MYLFLLKAHDLAVEFKTLDEPGETVAESASNGPGNSSIPIRRQPRIDVEIHKQARDAYKKLLVSSYLMAVDGQPLSFFKTLVKVQKANGVQLIDGTDNCNKAREFIHEIAQAIRFKLVGILCSTSVFSLLSDGSQPKKTGSEKELIFIRTVRSGSPVSFIVGLQDVGDFGDPNASNLKRSIDDIFENKVVIPHDKYVKGLIAATADGASVNMGQYNGLLAKLRNEDRPWLISIHCVSHRVELAMKDAILKISEFEDIKQFMITLYYTMKKSGKFQNHVKKTAEALDVQIYKFAKVHGTRFVNHQRKGVTNIIHNWIPLALAIENSIAGNEYRNISAKLRGILKKLKDYRFLASACLYKEILDIVSMLSLKFEEGNLLVYEVIPAVDETKSRLQGLLEDMSCPVQNAGIIIVSDDHEIKRELPKPGHMSRLPQNREFVQVSYSPMTFCEVETASRKIVTTNFAQVGRLLGQ